MGKDATKGIKTSNPRENARQMLKKRDKGIIKNQKKRGREQTRASS
jgi:hypothetical protein